MSLELLFDIWILKVAAHQTARQARGTPRRKLAWLLEPATAEQAHGTEEGERGFGSKRTDWAMYPDAEGTERSGGQSGLRVEPAPTWACPGPVSFDVGRNLPMLSKPPSRSGARVFLTQARDLFRNGFGQKWIVFDHFQNFSLDFSF